MLSTQIYSAKHLGRSLVPCPKCKMTGFEKEMKQFLMGLNKNFEIGNRQIISPKEVDFYLPEHNIAIECNGLYWHTESKIQNFQYHQKKYLSCKEKEIQLISIWEDDWFNSKKRQIIKNYIKNILKIKEEIFDISFAKILLIDKQTAKSFLNEHSLQGFIESSIYVGLFYNNSLISVMSIKKNKKDLIISNFASKYCIENCFKTVIEWVGNC